ncbi:ActS/PrrB/RegB family redox-sensitive histidine kinase [Lutimaribacter sp. EGI FJ00015]|uniref:ActS/PrrB/RegB family redox-sensitive histidine kinase n=1 Tax=Lutimaribacter degradans TaxID=2945989 RepID=A0ACC5ZUZ3_9RHOB|nr:ActS/PrrB/RegB family redox-sensitive histidine kinase [Lutimaribacter sp. EGI FJ00013]MCO0612965.1 ActS/PrrB/RegB family redox-sensitive histidine kinase [Lutimaribacter sp. EGI FJ00015]MCO0635835.1 ActS/PrrB/RegB family redox-sensitive histidine kinase [Lutimaribacter sp. EGI FJ00014]
MVESDLTILKGRNRGNWIRLRTIILLRWGAITGQLSALMVANQVYALDLEYALCLLVVGVSVIGNLVATFIFPENKRLSETENLLMVLFDLLQLSLLLYLTGGLHNPFSVLILGPVVISANVLKMRSTMFVGLTAISAVSVLATAYVPLRTADGALLRIPDLFIFGNWVSIVIAVVFLSIYSRRVTVEMHTMSDALQATQMALSREQRLTDLGGVVAAAAHELGTPLATIKLASAELAEVLEDDPELAEDARLIRDQADRCRDILRSMGQAGKDDLHLRQAPLSAVIEEAAGPHIDRGKELLFDFHPAAGADPAHPAILRRPEIIHGLRNLVQNAVDFAHGRVWIEGEWTDGNIVVRIMDDGRGFPQQLLGRIGDPFMRRRRSTNDTSARPEYEGMGLGLFIAKTLLERTGAELSFANGHDPFLAPSEHPERCGAIIEVSWPRDRIDVRAADLPVTARNELLQI